MLENQIVLLLCTMKNEGPYVLEWVAHHLSVGIDRFMVFTNDCDDGTDLILEELSRHIDMVHLTNPRVLFPDRADWHIIASKYAQTLLPYKRAGWIYTTDADEFLQIGVGDGTLQAFRDAAGPFDVVSFTSIPFGSNGRSALEDRPVMEQFTQKNKIYPAKAEGAQPFFNAIKTMHRNSIKFNARRNHRPIDRQFSKTGLRWIDGSGNLMDAEFTDGKSKGINALTSTKYAWFNHYAIKSRDAYLVKVDRGDASGATERQQSRQYWESYNRAGDLDTRAATLRPAAKEWLDRFHADPVLHELHKAAFAKHQEKAAALRARSESVLAAPSDAISGDDGR